MTGPQERAIRSILVCGGGITAWSAATAFARALPLVKVSLLALPEHPNALADRIPVSLPSVGRFHAAAGIDELELVSSGAAVHHLGTRFDHWSADGRSWIHAHGEHGVPSWPVPFRGLWSSARKAGRALPVHCYSAAGVMAEAGKFVHPKQDGRWPLSTYRYGLRFEPATYRAVLERHCAASGVERIAGALASVERTERGLAAVVLEDGRRVEADLFVDCSGPDARLLNEVEPEFESWARLFPFDRFELERVEGQAAPTDEVTASRDGWSWTLPLASHRLRILASASKGRPGVRFGRRAQPWVGNVLALGDSAATLDPLHGINANLVHSGILRALDLLPGRDFHPIELAEYNRRFDQEVTRARDFLAVHYIRSGRSDGDVWKRAAAVAPPDSLGHTLDQFESRGRLPFYEQESFTVDSWSAALLSLGALPQASDSIVGRYPLEESLASLDALAKRLKSLPAQLPPYRDYLDRMTRPGRQGRSAISSPAP